MKLTAENVQKVFFDCMYKGGVPYLVVDLGTKDIDRTKEEESND